MERFSIFNDRTSGVNPFTVQPYRPTATQSAVSGLLLALKAPFLALCVAVLYGVDCFVRAVSATCLLREPHALESLAGALSTPFPARSRVQCPLDIINRAARLTVERAASRALLFLLGFYSIEWPTVGKATLRVRPSKSNPSTRVHSGDILIANRCSWVDVLILSAQYAPQFTVTTQQGGLKPVGLFAALTASAVGSPATWATTSSSGSAAGAAAAASASADAEASVDAVLTSALERYLGPVVVFPEAAPTNNKAVLQFAPVAEQIARAVVTIAKGKGSKGKLRVPTTHVLAFRYKYTAFPTVYTGGAAGAALRSHALQLAGQANNSHVTVFRLPEGYDPQPADFHSSADAPTSSGGSGSGSSGASAGVTSTTQPTTSVDSSDAAGSAAATTWGGAVRDAIVKMLRTSPGVALSAAEFDAFVALARTPTGAAAATKKTA